jgi:hypothetical protein
VFRIFIIKYLSLWTRPRIVPVGTGVFKMLSAGLQSVWSVAEDDQIMSPGDRALSLLSARPFKYHSLIRLKIP